MSGYGSVQSTLNRTNFPIYFDKQNELKLYGQSKGRSQLGSELISRMTPPSSQLTRLQGNKSRYMNLGLIPGHDNRQEWAVSNTMSRLTDEPARRAMSSVSVDRPPLITITNAKLENQAVLNRERYVQNNRKNFTYLPQRPVYSDVKPIGM